MANENKKTLSYVIGAIVIIVILVFLFRGKPEAPVEPAPVVPEPEPAPVLPEPEVPTEYVGEAEMVSSAVCADGKIGAVLTNVGDVAVAIGTDLKIQFRGMVIKNPGCDKEELAPGESTTCTTLNDFHQVGSGQQEVLVRGLGAKEGKATVTCE